MAAVVVGCTTIIGIDVRPSRLELGATDTINGAEADAVEEIGNFTGGADYSLETTAGPGVFR